MINSEYKEFTDAYDGMLHSNEARISFNVTSDMIEILVNGEKAGYIEFGITYLDSILDSFDEMDLGFNPHSLKHGITFGERVAYVELLYINREFRRKGLAGIVMKKFIEEMHGRGIFQIVLRVEPDEESIEMDDLTNFYEKFGFKEIDRTDEGGILMIKI